MFVVEADNLLVSATFYAALDPRDLLCWTDERSRAELFASQDAAERFCATHMGDDQDWIVRPAT